MPEGPPPPPGGNWEAVSDDEDIPMPEGLPPGGLALPREFIGRSLNACI